MIVSEPLPHLVNDLLAYLHESHPTYATLDGVHTHDDLLEDKSRQALSRYLGEQGFSFRELDRIIEVDGKTVAEWEGVFELEDGEIWFLECKHCVSTVFYPVDLYLTACRSRVWEHDQTSPVDNSTSFVKPLESIELVFALGTRSEITYLGRLLFNIVCQSLRL